MKNIVMNNCPDCWYDGAGNVLSPCRKHVDEVLGPLRQDRTAWGERRKPDDDFPLIDPPRPSGTMNVQLVYAGRSQPSQFILEPDDFHEWSAGRCDRHYLYAGIVCMIVAALIGLAGWWLI